MIKVSRGNLYYGGAVLLKVYQQVSFTFETALAYSAAFEELSKNIRGLIKAVESEEDKEVVQAFLEIEEEIPIERILLTKKDLEKLNKVDFTPGEVGLIKWLFQFPEK